MRWLRGLAGRSVLSAGLVLSAAAPAGAGAWTRAEGEGLIIATTARRVAPAGALIGGVAHNDVNIGQIYLEYGLLDGLTIGAKVYMELSTTDVNGSSASLGGFVRRRVWRDGKGGVASVEVGYAHPIDSLLGAAFAESRPGAVPEAHLAGLHGYGWAGEWGSAFVSTSAAYHYRGEGEADQLRFEITSGYAPWRRIRGMVSLYALAPLGGGTDASLKIAPSVAYTIWPRVSRDGSKPRRPVKPVTIQLGVSHDLLKPGDGLELSISIWRPF